MYSILLYLGIVLLHDYMLKSRDLNATCKDPDCHSVLDLDNVNEHFCDGCVPKFPASLPYLANVLNAKHERAEACLSSSDPAVHPLFQGRNSAGTLELEVSVGKKLLALEKQSGKDTVNVCMARARATRDVPVKKMSSSPAQKTIVKDAKNSAK